MHQTCYTFKFLNRFGMTDIKLVKFLIEISTNLKKSEAFLDVSMLLFRKLVGSLTNLATVVKPDNNFAVSY